MSQDRLAGQMEGNGLVKGITLGFFSGRAPRAAPGKYPGHDKQEGTAICQRTGGEPGPSIPAGPA